MPVRSPMRLGLRGKLFLLSLVLTVTGLFGAHAYVSRALDRDLETRTYNELGASAGLAAAAVRRAAAFDTQTADPLVRELASESRARVTLIDPRGRVIADSAVPTSRVGELDNHATRPEVRLARDSGSGSSFRHSGTLHEPLIYLGRRVVGPDGGPWVVRLAFTPQLVATAQGAIRRFLVLGAVLGLLAAALVSSIGVSLLTRPVRSVTAAARMMVSDLAVRTRVHGGDEIGELAAALDELAEGQSRSLSSLARERDRLGDILEAMAEGVLVIDARGVIVLANRALREMFLVGRDVIGRTPVEAVRSAELHDAIAEARRTGGAVTREIAITGLLPRTATVRLAPTHDADGAGGTVAVLTDVTDLRRLEVMRREFVANVSHELRTPIAAVRAAAETLQSGAADDPETTREFLSIIERHAQRLHRLVEDLLDLSRIEARQLNLELETIDITAAARRANDLFRIAAEQKRIRLTLDAPAGVTAVHGDVRAIEQILSNLVDNAIKYSPENSAVTVRVRPREHGVRVSVEDTGSGIEERHLPRLFERFYRVDPGRSREVGGTGLGLAIVKHLAEAMGGSVSVTSAIGKGSTFSVDLMTADDAG